MVDISKKLEQGRVLADLSGSNLAALAGVSQSTVARVLKGQLAPTWPVVDELLTVLGANPYQATVDVDAIAAVRLALTPDAEINRTAGSDRWIGRWGRIGLIGEDGCVAPGRRADLLFRASTVARLTERTGITGFDPDTDLDAATAAWDESGIQWCATGTLGLGLTYPTPLWGPTLYVSDVAEARRAAQLAPRREGDRRVEVKLIPFDGVSEVGRTVMEEIWVANEDQVLLDCYATGGRVRELADIALGVRE